MSFIEKDTNHTIMCTNLGVPVSITAHISAS